MTAATQRLRALAAAKEPTTILEVLERMRAIDAVLPPADGLAWFTKLYLRVTEAVHASLHPQAFRDPRFLAHLDVVFANLYFAALRGPAPKAWAPLLEARLRRRVAPVQFALAGMNAHINRDLPVALVRTCEELRVELPDAAEQHHDFVTVNGLLAQTEAKVKRWFSTGFVGVVDEAFGKADDRVAIWNVGRARDAAWVQAETLWALRAVPALQHRYLDALDRTVGFAGRGLLVPLA